MASTRQEPPSGTVRLAEAPDWADLGGFCAPSLGRPQWGPKVALPSPSNRRPAHPLAGAPRAALGHYWLAAASDPRIMKGHLREDETV